MENLRWKTEKGRFCEVVAFFILSIALLSCTESKPEPKVKTTDSIASHLDEMKEVARHHKPLPDSLKDGAHSLQGAIHFLEAHNSIEDYVVGDGRRSMVFPAYQILRREADNTCLFRLLKSETPAVRVYAFVTLTQRDSTLWDTAWDQLRGKKDKLFAQSNCNGDIHSVDLLCIAPLDFVLSPVETREVLVKDN